MPGVVSSPFPPSRPACPAVCVAGRLVRVPLVLARWYAIPCGLCISRARSSCPSVILACPLRVCALSVPRRPRPPLPPLVGVARASRAVPMHSVRPLHLSCPGPVLCLVCFSGGGGGPVPFPPYLAWGCGSPWGRPARLGRSSAEGQWWGAGGGLCAVPPVCAARGATWAGGRLASVRLSAFPGQATKRVFCTSLVPWRAWPPYRSSSPRLLSSGAVRVAPWCVGQGSLVHHGSCGSRRLGHVGGPCSGLPPGRRGPAGGRGDHLRCLSGGGGWGCCGLRVGGGVRE